MIVIEKEHMEHPEITIIPNNVPPKEAQKFAKAVEYPEEMPFKEAVEYARYFEINHPEFAKETGVITLNIVPENPKEVDIDFYEDKNIPFERIRRITGYLVGTVDRWNNGKSAELKDRVKHFSMDER